MRISPWAEEVLEGKMDKGVYTKTGKQIGRFKYALKGCALIPDVNSGLLIILPRKIDGWTLKRNEK